MMKIIFKNILRGLLAMFLLALLLVAVRPLAAQSNATIRVGVYNFEPLIFIDKDGALKGIYLDVLEAIAAREGWRIEYVPGTWQECLTRLETGAIDVLPSIGYTEERAQKLDFTNEYLFLDWGLVYRGKGKPIQTALDLDGKKIAALKGSIYTLGLTKLLDQFDLQSQIVEKDEYTQVLTAVERGEVDAGIITKVYGLVLERNYPQIEATEIFFAPVKIFFAVPKGQHAALRATLDREFAALKADKNSIYYSSLNKWIGLYQSKEVLPTQVIVGFAGTLALLALFFGFTLVLRQQVAQRTRELQADIAERVRAEAALRESEARLRLISESTADVIWVLDPSAGKFTYVSPAVEKLRGYTPAEVMAQPIENAMTPESLQRVGALLAKRIPAFMAKGTGTESYYTDQVDQPRKDGTIVHTEVTTTYLFDARGQVEIVGVSRDITERKRAEEELKNRNAFIETILENAPIGFAVNTIHDGQRVFVSRNFERIYGVPYNSLNSIDEYFEKVYLDPVFREQIRERIMTDMATGDAARMRWEEIPITTITGEHKIITAINIPLLDQDLMISTVQDVTQRWQAERARRKSETRYHDLVETSQDLIWQCDREGRYIYLNPAWEQLFGYTLEEMLGKRFSDFQTPKMAAHDLQELAWLIQGNSVKGFETVHIGKAGNEIHLVFNAKFQTDEMGNIIGTLGTAYDITDRKRAEEKLRASEASLRESQRVAHIGHWSWDMQTNQVEWSDEMKRIFGLDPAIFNGDLTQVIARAIHPDDQAKVNAANQTVLTEQKSPPLEYRVVLPDQSVRTILASPGERVVNASGDILKLTGIVQDITERKRAEDDIRELNAQLEQRVVERTAELNARVDQVEQLNRALANLLEDLQLANRKQEQAAAELVTANDALKAKNRELEMFTYSVSHDLKAPLRGIDGYSRLLLDDYADKLDEDGRAFLQTIRRATDQMACLIDDLLAYSRVERRALTTGVVHPQALVDALVIERADDFKRRKVALNVALACAAISTDADGLTLILRNLLDNALKFTRDVSAPQIEIGGRDEANACVLWVRDNGIGFEMKYHDRIFEIFQRLHRAEDYPGTGIGLAIVRKALERIGGRVWAESTPDQGATFFVEIPR